MDRPSCLDVWYCNLLHASLVADVTLQHSDLSELPHLDNDQLLIHAQPLSRALL